MPDNPKSEAVFAALRQIEGVDDKLLKRPEVAHLPSVLEEDELPSYLVTNGRSSLAGAGILFATDRRIIYLEKSSWSSSIKKIETYPYADIQSIEAGESVWDPPLGVQIISSKKMISLDADKEWRSRFAEHVSSRLPTNPVFEILRGLTGDDDELLKRSDVLHLPSVLDDGELPRFAVTTGKLRLTTVTDRRIITIKQAMLSNAIEEVNTYQLDEIQWVRALSGEGFLGEGVRIDFLIGGQGADIFVDSEAGFELADYLRANIPPNPAVEALRKLDTVDEEFLRRVEVGFLASVLEEGELPKAVAHTPRQVQVLFATDRRIIMIRSGNFTVSIDEVDSFPYGDVESVEIRENVVLKPLWLKVAGRDDVIQTSDMKVKKAFVDFVSAKINSL